MALALDKINLLEELNDNLQKEKTLIELEFSKYKEEVEGVKSEKLRLDAKVLEKDKIAA